ncbi:hypothetical protein NBRC116592_36750 [Colwellia sp. KU-HH00111]
MIPLKTINKNIIAVFIPKMEITTWNVRSSSPTGKNIGESHKTKQVIRMENILNAENNKKEELTMVLISPSLSLCKAFAIKR